MGVTRQMADYVSGSNPPYFALQGKQDRAPFPQRHCERSEAIHLAA
jgi:hypothetical protein